MAISNYVYTTGPRITFASDKEVAFDIDQLKQLRDHTKSVRKKLDDQRNNLKKGLDELRKDWKTNAGNYFFEKIDVDWEAEIVKFENTISMFEEILNDAISQFEEVVFKAESINLTNSPEACRYVCGL